jgi:hypothetical protein
MGVITEKYPAKVTFNDDPEQRGRIRVACSGLLGDEESELPQLVEPVMDWGWFIVPDIGELVEIEVVTDSSEDEQLGQASIDNLDIKWRGARFYGNEEGEQPTPVPDDFKTNYGKRRGFATPGGHILLFDDTPGKRRMTFTWADGEGEFSFIGIDEDGSIIMGTKSGHMLLMDAKNGALTLIDQNSNLYSSDKDGIKIIDKNSNLMEFKGSTVQILSQGALTISCKDAVIDAGKIQLGGQPLTEAVLKGVAMVAALASHTHLGVVSGPGVTGPPIPTDIAAFVAALSTAVFTK